MATNTFSDTVLLQDNTAIHLGTDGDGIIQYDETTDDRVEVTGAAWHFTPAVELSGASTLSGDVDITSGNLTVGNNSEAPWIHVDVLDDATSRFGTISVGLATNYSGWIRYQTTGGSEWFSSGVTTGGSPIECWRIQRTASPKFNVLVDADFDASLNIANGANIELNTGTGTKIGTSTTQKLGFWNATPVVQQSHIVDAVTSHAFSASYSDMELEDALDDMGNKVNEILTLLETLGLVASS